MANSGRCAIPEPQESTTCRQAYVCFLFRCYSEPYYEKIGVMPKPARSAGGYRVYGNDHARRLHFVRRGRELGFSLDELRGLLRLVDGHSYTCREVHDLTIEHLKDIRQKIADLRRLERAMSDMAAQCTGNQVPECPIIDALFEMRPVGRSRSVRP